MDNIWIYLPFQLIILYQFEVLICSTLFPHQTLLIIIYKSIKSERWLKCNNWEIYLYSKDNIFSLLRVLFLNKNFSQLVCFTNPLSKSCQKIVLNQSIKQNWIAKCFLLFQRNQIRVTNIYWFYFEYVDFSNVTLMIKSITF